MHSFVYFLYFFNLFLSFFCPDWQAVTLQISMVNNTVKFLFITLFI